MLGSSVQHIDAFRALLEEARTQGHVHSSSTVETLERRYVGASEGEVHGAAPYVYISVRWIASPFVLHIPIYTPPSYICTSISLYKRP